MVEESNEKQAFLDTLLTQNNGKISKSVCRKSIHTYQYLRYSSHQQTSCKEGVVSSLFNKAYPFITNKDGLTKKHKEKASGKREWISRKHCQ